MDKERLPAKKMSNEEKDTRRKEIEAALLTIEESDRQTKETLEKAMAALKVVEESKLEKDRETPYNLPKLSPETEKKIAYLEEELERQKRALVHIESLGNTTEEGLSNLRKNIELTQQTIDNLKYVEEIPTSAPETATPMANPEDLFSVNDKILYQGDDYRISETPNENNKNKYILVHPTGKPIYKLTREQLFKQIENGNAVLVSPALQTTETAENKKTEALKNLREEIANKILELERVEKELAEIRAQNLPETASFPKSFIEDKITKMLQGFDKVTKVISVEAPGTGNKISLALKILAGEDEIGINADINNIGGVFMAKNLEIKAGTLTKIYLKRKIKSKLDQIEELLQNEVETETGKKVTKIWIENGELRVEFEKNAEEEVIIKRKAELQQEQAEIQRILSEKMAEEKKLSSSESGIPTPISTTQTTPSEVAPRSEPVTPPQKEKIPEKKFDTAKTAEEINAKIAEEEAIKGTPFSPEEKKARFLELLWGAHEKFGDETIDSAGWLKNPLKKFDKWWTKDLEKNKWKKAGKIAASTAIISASTLLAGAGMGIIPTGSIATKFLTRVIMATGFNMALTSHRAGKIMGVFKKEATGIETNKQRKIFNLQNGMMLASTGTAFIFSAVAVGTGAGLAAGGVALGSMVVRRAFNTFVEKKIKEKRKRIEEIKGNFDINALVDNFAGFEAEYEKANKSLKKWEWGKNLVNGATTISTGLATMEVLSHGAISSHGKLSEEDTGPDAMKVLNKANAKIRELTSEEKTPEPGTAPISENVKPEEMSSPAFQNEGIKFEYGKGGIQGILDLKKQIREAYGGDYSKAPQSVQNFMNTDATKEAIDLGLFKPDQSAESALMGEGSVLKFDEHGNLSLHDTITNKDSILVHGENSEIEQYGGKMLDSDKSGEASVSSANAPKSSESFHLVDEHPAEFGKFGNVDLLGKHLEPDYKESAEVVAAREKVFATMEETNQKHPEDVLHKENTTIPETIATTKGTGLLEEYKNIIKNHPEFAKYSRELTPVKLVEFYETHKGNTGYIFRDDASDSWEKLKDLRVMKLLDQTGSSDPATRHLAEYIRLIRRYTGLNPKSGWFTLGRGKTAEEYIVGGLKILTDEKKLGQFEADLRK